MNSISAAEAVNLYQAEKSNYQWIDVRTPEEFRDGHIPEAQNINIMSADFESKVSKLPKDKAYIIVCRSGNRSGSACRAMEKLGFTNVTNMAGGMMSWRGPVK